MRAANLSEECSEENHLTHSTYLVQKQLNREIKPAAFTVR